MTYLEKLAIAAQLESVDKPFMWFGVVRAVLAAMKDPPHEITEPVVPVGEDRTKAVHMWNAMIQAALNEPLSEG